jgi:DeoR family ulaG and ulaABCDEF operon transcriptional repressor
MSQAEKIIVVVDSSKFQVRNSLILCSLDQVDTLITDSGINDESRQMLKDSGVNLKIAEVAIS